MGATLRRALFGAALACSCVALPGCLARTQRGTALFDYLARDDVESPAAMRTRLVPPLRVVVAFVPSLPKRARAVDAFDEAQRRGILEELAFALEAHPKVETAVAVPGAELAPGGGFFDLEELCRRRGANAALLVTFEQTQIENYEGLAVSYLTLLGAFVFRGNRSATSTILTASLWDPLRRTAVLEASATSRVKERATLVGSGRALREAGARGFEEAGIRLAAELVEALERYPER